MPAGAPLQPFPCDDAIVAIGQEPALPWIERDLGLAFDARGLPEIDPKTLQSAHPKVFFGGDAAFGPKNIITAVAHGHEAAISIDRFLSGADIQKRPAPAVTLTPKQMQPVPRRIPEVSSDTRFAVPLRSQAAALADIRAEVELGFDTTPIERALHGKHTNVFAAGAIGRLAGLPAAPLHAALAAVLGGKSAEVTRTNAAELEAGRAAATSLDLDMRLASPHPAARWLMTGNQAIAVGALRSGVRFVGCYPITPAIDLVEWMAPQLQKLGGRLALAEDELAAINMVLGASYGGVPAMTVTSGPGLSLMVESIGLDIAAEIPAVILDVLRGGPSTGIPSKTEQSDVNIAIYGGHGDAPRVVLAPSISDDGEEP